MFLDRRVQGSRIGADNLTNLLAIFEEFEGRHGTNGELLSNIRELIDVDLVEVCVGEFATVLDDSRSNGLAGAAPRREAVEHDQLVFGVVKGFLPLRLAIARSVVRKRINRQSATNLPMLWTPILIVLLLKRRALNVVELASRSGGFAIRFFGKECLTAMDNGFGVSSLRPCLKSADGRKAATVTSLYWFLVW